MKLPDYYLADVPEGAVLTPQMITDACLTLKENRDRHLAGCTTAEMIEVLADVAADWLEPENPFRRLALERGVEETGFSRETIERGLDALFESVTVDSLRRLVVQDLGDRARLDQPVAGEGEQQEGRQALAVGPRLLAHVTGGVLPTPPIVSLMLGLLVRSAQFMKCARGTSFLPRLFAHSIREVRPKLASCIEIAEWTGGTEELENALWAQADCVTVMGRDETVQGLRQRLPAGVRLVGYGHRVSLGYVGAEMLSGRVMPGVVRAAAADVAAWDQLGCLSPQTIYVEAGGRHTPEQFAEELAGALERLEIEQPRGRVNTATAASIASRRSCYAVRAANRDDTWLWRSRDSTAWTVVFDGDALFRASCLHRFVQVQPVGDVEELLRGLEPVRGRVSTVGVAVSAARERALVERLAAWGITRVCPLGRMQQPPLTWRHDGRPGLGELVTWCDWEMPSPGGGWGSRG